MDFLVMSGGKWGHMTLCPDIRFRVKNLLFGDSLKGHNQRRGGRREEDLIHE